MILGDIRSAIRKKLPGYGALLAIILLLLLSFVSVATAIGPGLGNPVVYHGPSLNLFQSLTMNITVNTTTAYVSSPINVIALAKYPNGTVVSPGYMVTLTCSPSGGSFGLSSLKTGYYNVKGVPKYFAGIDTNFAASSPNTYTITATVSDPSGVYLNGTATQVIQIYAMQSATQSPTISTSQGDTGTTQTGSTDTGTTQTGTTQTGTTQTGTSQSATATPAAAATLTVTPTSTPVPSTNTTAAGTTNGGSNLGGAVSSIMPILPYLIIGVIILLLIIAILAYLWLKKSLKVEARKSSAPCDGKSVIPIRVRFVNAFGMSRKWKNDVEVQMETTAGSIQNVVLPNGRDFMDTNLTTSREFGAVTVTGRYNGKASVAVVNFTYAQAHLELSISPASIPADNSSSANINIKIKDEGGNVISPLEDKVIELKSTLGKVPASIKMAARTESVSASIAAGDQSGTAVVTAICSSIKGEASLTLQGIPKRFCMHCGSSMSMEASKCPKCGLTPPSGVDTKQCSTCGVILPEAAKFCHKCGARQPEAVKAPAPQDSGTMKK